jgi:hypothetical protein
MMTNFDTDSYSDAELEAEFDGLFPQGFAGPDVLQELAPVGWENSPLVAVFHPSLAQTYEESLRFHRNLGRLRKSNDQHPPRPEPTFDEVASSFREHPIEAEQEVRELVGQCLWDVFSDSHEVVDRGRRTEGGGRRALDRGRRTEGGGRRAGKHDRRVLDLGSFRGSGAFLAEILNRQTGDDQYDYMSFYMGTIWAAQRADLTPVYRMIFRRLEGRGLDWVYHFPRLGVVDFRPLKAALEQKQGPDWLSYSPSKALAKEQEEAEHDKSLAELRESLDAGYREAIEEALNGPPPTTVRAYEEVYGCFPEGWPPVP